MNLDKIYRKMNLLKTMAEGNYGNETRNAINIIEKLKKEYNIRDFFYTPFSERIFREWHRVSFSSGMRNIVIDLIVKMNLKYASEKGKISVLVSEGTWDLFSSNLKAVKRQWKMHLNMVENRMFEFNWRFKN